MPTPPPQIADADCLKTACSGTICTDPDNEAVTTCEYNPEYSCYKGAKCDRQADGSCSWTETAELMMCLANPPPM